MSLLPMLFSSWWEDLERPHRLLNQHFGLPISPDDLASTALTPYADDILVLRPRRRGLHRYQPYETSIARKASGVSTVQPDKNKFHVTLDVQQFNPEEVTVKVVGNNVVVEGKHEERQDEHGWISRQFVRKYFIPDQCDIDQLKSSLSSDGVLTISAPRKETDPEKKNERIIKIQTTGQPALREESHKSDMPKEQTSQGSQTQKSPVQQRAQDKTVKAA